MPANLQHPKSMNEPRLDLQADAHLFFDTLFSGCSVLDVGAGLGRSKARIRHNTVTTYDIDPQLTAHVDILSSTLPDLSVDIVTAFDVLEHVEDDVRFAQQLDWIARRALFLTTPNWHVNQCRSQYHFREYTPGEMVDFAELIWPRRELRLFGFYKDGQGGWFDAVPSDPDQWRTHKALKHGLLVLKWPPDRERIDAWFSDRAPARPTP